MPPVTVDTFMLPNYDVPDAMPAAISNDQQPVTSEYKIPLVVWMFVFLIVGYVTVRAIMED